MICFSRDLAGLLLLLPHGSSLHFFDPSSLFLIPHSPFFPPSFFFRLLCTSASCALGRLGERPIPLPCRVSSSPNLALFFVLVRLTSTPFFFLLSPMFLTLLLQKRSDSPRMNHSIGRLSLARKEVSTEARALFFHTLTFISIIM